MTTLARPHRVPGKPLLRLLIATSLIVAATTTSADATTASARISRSVDARLARLAPPRIAVVGHKLVWSRVHGVSSYVFARHQHGHRSVHRVLAKTFVTPAPVPGGTVTYSVKTDVQGSAWAPPVTIIYNRWGGIKRILEYIARSRAGSHGQGSGSGTGSSGSGSGPSSASGSRSGSASGSGSSSGSGSGSSSGANSGSGSSSGSGTGSSGSGDGSVGEVAPVSERTSSTLKVGLVGGIYGWGATPSETIRRQTGVRYTKLTIGPEGWGTVGEMVRDGVTPLILYNPTMAGMSPAAVAEGVKSYAPHMHELGLSEIELGNEVYYNGSSPAEYAAQYRAAHEALAGSGITLIADAWTDTPKPNGEWSQWESHGGWCTLFVEALGYIPDAWSFHPYGPMNADGFGSGAYRQGWATVPRMISYMKADHIYAPLHITEVGQPTYQGSDGNNAVSEREQAADVKQYISQAAEWGVASIYLYEAIDTGEGGYGLYKWPLQAKPSATAFVEAVAGLSRQ